MKKLIIFALLAGLTACTNNSNPEVVNRQASVVSSGDGNYGLVPYGQNPIKSFVFKNSGLTAVSGAPILTGVGFNLALQLGCETIEPGKNCLVKVLFNSINKESGNYASTLTVGDATVNLSASIASVPNPNYSFSVNGEDLNTEELSLGELSGRNIKILTVKVKNSSPKTGQVSSLTMSNLRYRTLQTNCNSVVLKPNQSCIAKLVVQGDNTNVPLATQLSFDGQSGQISTQQVVQTLSGQMMAINSSIMLGDFYEEGTNKIQLLKIENQGNGAGNIDTSSIALPPGYSVGNNSCSNIKPGNSCIIRLVYSSSDLEKGSHTDTVSIGDSDVDLTVNQVSDPNDLQSLNLTVTENIPVGTCAPVSVSLKDSENLAYVSSQAISITATLTLYSDSNCATVDSLIIAPFESAKNLFIKNQTAGAMGLGIYVKDKYEEASLYFYSPLTLTSNKSNLVVGQQAQITVGGGRGPFSVETLSGGGTLNVGGLYTSDTVGVANFRVTDTVLNLQASVSINVASVLTANTLSFEKVIDQYHTVVGSGGLIPYTYTVVSGPGVIDSYTGVYNSNLSGNVVLKLKDALNQEVLINGQIYSPLIVTPLSKVIVSTGSHQITPSGGKSPYAYTKLSGSGSVNPLTGVFSSPTATTAQVKVIDSLGQEQTVSIQVVLPLTANSSFEKVVNQTLSIQGQNGLAPYSYTKVSGVGSIDSSTGLYSAGAVAGMVQLKVTDALNQEVLVNGQVYSQMVVAPLSKVIISTGSHQIIPSGGKIPYTYTKLSGAGSVDTISGIYSSATATTAQIKVSDALGQEQTVSIQVVLPLTASSSTFEKVVNQTLSLQGQNGLTPYVYTKVSGVGSIDSSTGLYSAGAVAGMVQLKITDAVNQEFLVNGQVYSQLNVTPVSKIIVSTNTYQIVPTGGKTPYSFTKLSGAGSVDSLTGLYSSATATTAQIKVSDSLGQEQTVSIQVVLPLTANIYSFEKIVNQTQSILGQNGLPPYVYTKVSGVGSIDSSSGLYSAGSVTGVVQLKITDALSQEVLVNGQVYSQLSLSPLNANIVLSQNQTFSASGGKLPYVFSRTSGVGDINSASGVFSSLTVGTAQIKVVDALSQEVSTGITVNSNLVLSAGTCGSSIPESVTCTVSATGGFGAKTYSVDVGTINSTSGDFKGICVNNLGSSVVTAMDANGNTTSLTLSYPCVYSSCNQIKAESYGLAPAVYWLDLDGLNTGTAPLQVFCDQTQDQGGWALVAKYGNTSNNTYHWFQPAIGTLNLNDTFDSSIAISSVANSLAIRSSEIKINYSSTAANYFTINQLTTDKNKLWSNTPVNTQLGVIGTRPTSGYTGTNFTPGQAVRMHYGSYSGAKGSGFTSGLSSNQTLDTISDAATYGVYRLPGIGAIPGSPAPWGLENANFIAYVKEPYYKYGISCADAKTRGLKNQVGNTSSGNYTIDPDGANMGVSPYTVYCDVVTAANSTMNATGGTITYSGNYKIHTFTNLGNTTFTITSGSGPVEILVAAGGGGGGASAYSLGGAGGGGAGGLVYSASYNLAGQTSSTITIGDGGNGGTAGVASNGSNGFNSSAFGITAIGGGGGGHGATCGAGQSGGSGGGAGYCGYGANNSNGGASQGNVGGRVVASPSNSAGGAGGGGAGAAGGSNFPTHNGGIGGVGLSYSISGAPVTYSTGGNGAGSNSALNGSSNTGNGGWGAYANSSAGGKGGSGIVIIKYQYKLP